MIAIWFEKGYTPSSGRKIPGKEFDTKMYGFKFMLIFSNWSPVFCYPIQKS